MSENFKSCSLLYAIVTSLFGKELEFLSTSLKQDKEM
jgi:hypothetical protein